ncbi:hypothetical protein RDABS01_007283, partial [Bienertia sinuspersici]
MDSTREEGEKLAHSAFDKIVSPSFLWVGLGEGIGLRRGLLCSCSSVGRQIPLSFLERVKDDFNKRYGVEKLLPPSKKFEQNLGSRSRGEKIELLVDKTENHCSQAQDFQQQGTQMRRKMWFQNMKIKLILL